MHENKELQPEKNRIFLTNEVYAVPENKELQAQRGASNSSILHSVSILYIRNDRIDI